MKNKLRVVELFAGVGGFRLGLEGWKQLSASSGYTQKFQTPFQVIWSNQWEPTTKTQHASIVYENRWGHSTHSNEDITSVDVTNIPDHDVLVGGFPCQDYSVATTLKNSKGLLGKKGVLWWAIQKILHEKTNKPKYLILENVDRLLISPSNQRGRDFAIILKSLNDLGYAVEWRVINAAEYGMPQKRKRIFILAYHQNSSIYQQITETEATSWVLCNGVLATAFPVQPRSSQAIIHYSLEDDIVEISEKFNQQGARDAFLNSGLMINHQITTIKVDANYQGKYKVLGDILTDDEIPEAFKIVGDELTRWEYLKGSKKEMRKTLDGFEYHYSEGSMTFPDALDKPSRTIITGEGGKSPSRFKHVIQTNDGYRRLLPIELERLNMFPDYHTQIEGMADTKRAFFMGNALIVGVVEKIGIALTKKIESE
jgi:DNA (cytosine-5)-methyltransferase 1